MDCPVCCCTTQVVKTESKMSFRIRDRVCLGCKNRFRTIEMMMYDDAVAFADLLYQAGYDEKFDFEEAGI